MKLLLIGNSQLSCIKQAFDKYGFSNSEHQLYFYIMPGGWGPSFNIENGLLKVNPVAVVNDFPPTYFPDDVLINQVESYDLILVSALGHYDGGFKYINDSSFLLQGVVPELGLKDSGLSSPVVSKSCISEMMNAFFMDYQLGFKFIRHLRANYSGKILLQPFPLLSESVKLRSDWLINLNYLDPLATNLYFLSLKDRLIVDFCLRENITVLDYPSDEWRSLGFTPANYMSEIDGIHPTPEYGKMILDQLQKFCVV